MVVGLEDQVIIVTGAANGIDRAIARAAATAGAQALMITDIDAAGLRETAKDLPDDVQVHTHIGDLVDTATAHVIASAVLDHFGRIDGLVNAAGVTTRASVIDGTEADWDTIFAINTRAPFFLMQTTILDLQNATRPAPL